MDRYARQIAFAEFGREGQEALGGARVLIVGLGGLGSHVAEILCRMGVGGLRLVDRDYVDESNLHRQCLYTEEDAEQVKPKVIALRDHLKAIQPRISIEARLRHVDASNVRRLLKGVDVVVDGSDNLDLRLLLNEACVRAGKPFIFGAVGGASGLAMGVVPGKTACLRCLLDGSGPLVPASTAEMGLYPPVVRMVSAFQAHLTIRGLLPGTEVQEWAGRVYALDAWRGEMEATQVARRTGEKGCPVCVRREFEYLEAEGHEGPQVVVEEGVINVLPERKMEVDLEVLRARLHREREVKANEYLIWARLGDLEVAFFKDGRISVKGASDWSEAVRVYERYLGE